MARSTVPDVSYELASSRTTTESLTNWLARPFRVKLAGSAHRGWFSPLLIALGLAGLVALLATIVGTGPNDYTYYLRPAAQQWLAGNSRLYDAGAKGFYFPPWSLLLLAPTTLFDPALGQAIINVLGLIGIVWALATFGRGLRSWIWVLAATPFFVIMLLIRGNLDGVSLLGLGLSWWAVTKRRPWALAVGLWLASLKPINLLPLIPYLVWLAWRWRLREKLAALSLMLVSMVSASVLFGLDWPLRYVGFSLAAPPADYLAVNLWKLSGVLGLEASAKLLLGLLVMCGTAFGCARFKTSATGPALAMAGWFLLTPYAQEIHYVLLIPALLAVARWNRAAAGVAYLASYTPLLRIPFGYVVNQLDLVYPATLWLALVGIAWVGAKQPVRRIVQGAVQT